MKTRLLVQGSATQIRGRLLGGAALSVLLAMGISSPTYAATAKKHKAPAVSAQTAELRALREQVQALTDRLNAQEAAQQQTQAQAQQAVQQVQQVQQVQAQATAQIETIPTQVKTAVAAIPKPVVKTSWADNTTVSGRMYYNISNIDQKSDGKKQAPSGTGLDIKRFYLGVDHKFNDVFSANLTTDVNYVSNDSETQIYIKKAYLQAKLSDALTVRVGSADLPWVPFVEDLYGYRYVENTLIDRTKFGTSADWGVHALGKLADGKVSYAISVIDGAGYKAPLRSKGVDIEGRISYVPVDHLTLAIGGYTGKLGKDAEGAAPTFHTAERLDAIAAYTTDKYRAGVEYFNAKSWNNVTTAADDKSNGYSLFGSYNFTPQIAVFGRYDWLKPKADQASNNKDNYFNIGISYEPTKIVDFALLYKRDKVDNGILATSNGNIGGVREGTYDEFGLFGQFRF
jgi:hypothetical protein